MPDLVAQGPEPGQRWRRPLPEKTTTLGRETLCDLACPWDGSISRLHAILTLEEGKLHVRRNPMARNSIFFQGKSADDFSLALGEFFLIGKTRFLFTEDSQKTPTSEVPHPVSELTCSSEELEAVTYPDAADRVEALSRLPGLIRYSPTDAECERQVADVLLHGVPRADVAAVVRVDPRDSAARIEVRAVASRASTADGFQPSRRLVLDALQKHRQPVLHRWSNSGDEFTVAAGLDWSLCAPLPDDPEPGWALYLAKGAFDRGSVASEEALRGDLKFTGLVADIFGALRQMRDLQRRKSLLESFLSPTVLAALATQDMDEVLKPRQVEVTVLFCDLRGFSALAEAEELQDICDRVGEALSVMTRNILDKDGVIGNFQGDSAMGFFGWPFGGDDHPEQAIRAALAIRKEFERCTRRSDHPLANFSCGIGLADGHAIAGRLGTPDVFQVGVFGPVVNLASRLESLTRHFQVPILLDDRLAEKLRGSRFRLRRIARLRPYGMKKTVLAHELMVPRHEPGAMPEQDQRDFEAALDHFLAGRWTDARRLLDLLRGDRPAEVLRDYIDRNGAKVPANWDGVIALERK